MIVVDRPVWTRDDRRYAHLASDRSFEELHAFVDALVARQVLGYRPRLHGDHCDIPAEHWPDVVRAGAVVVSTRELVHGLRVAGRRRNRRSRAEAEAPQRL
jgi:hypothetical protein